MSAPSSTSSSRTARGEWRLFALKLAALAALFPVSVSVLEAGLRRVGELGPLDDLVEHQASDQPFLFLRALTDQNFAYKLRSVARQRPELLLLGSSRVNQMRAPMFAPYRFYNGGNVAFTFEHYTSFLKGLPADYAPEVLLIAVDPFMFLEDWGDRFEHLDRTLETSWRSRLSLYERFLVRSLSDPTLPFLPRRDPLHGLPARGLHALKSGKAYRNDGSLQYSARVRNGSAGYSRRNYDEAVATHLEWIDARTGKYEPASTLAERTWDDLERLRARCEQLGTRVIAFTPPIAPEVLQHVLGSPEHGMWRAFFGPDTRERFAELGFAYFDFSGHGTFERGQFIDAMHPTERSYLQLALTMARSDAGGRLLPRMSIARLESHLGATSSADVFGSRISTQLSDQARAHLPHVLEAHHFAGRELDVEPLFDGHHQGDVIQ
jgi:hypothetical protein